MLDRNCPNESFKDMRVLLQENNVRNNQFMLEVSDKSMINFGSDNDFLPKGISTSLVRSEARENIWYFFRRILKIPTTYGRQLHMFELTPLAMEVIWLFEHGFSIYIEDSGGYGVTTLLTALNVYCDFVGRGSEQITALPFGIKYNPGGIKRKITSIKQGGSLYTQVIKSIFPIDFFIGVNINTSFDPYTIKEVDSYKDRLSNDPQIDTTRLRKMLMEMKNELSNPEDNTQRIVSVDIDFRKSVIVDDENFKDYEWVRDIVSTPFDISFFDLSSGEIEKLKSENKFIYISTKNDRLCNTGLCFTD